MSGDPLQHVQSGDPLEIGAETFNTMIDAARAFKASRGVQSRTPKREVPQTGIVLVKNTSGAARNRFDVLGVAGPIIGPADNLDVFKSHVALRGVVPTEDHVGRFVVLLEPLDVNAIGRACVSGATVARVEMDEESHTQADVKDGDASRLLSAGSGIAGLLWVQPEGQRESPGQAWAVVRLGGGGGGAALSVAYFAIKAITTSTLTVQKLKQDAQDLWIEDGDEFDAYPMPGRLPLDYHGLEWPGDDYANGRFIPVQGQRGGNGRWYLNLLITPFDLVLQDGTDTGG